MKKRNITILAIVIVVAVLLIGGIVWKMSINKNIISNNSGNANGGTTGGDVMYSDSGNDVDDSIVVSDQDVASAPQ